MSDIILDDWNENDRARRKTESKVSSRNVLFACSVVPPPVTYALNALNSLKDIVYDIYQPFDPVTFTFSLKVKGRQATHI